ncbi:GNAT family N-acetyltransferase [Brevibacillus daliensis]|uniref:GNAT family N-acetyltransferase n=1 Tax=Brevibacillus daliensis TaxID=2892995 RepID=UPI001E505A22|nr:GNAT family N-acetyltransferase [Brevibacillus daliensis]
MSIRLQTDELLINTLKENELPKALHIYNSNPAYNEWTNGDPSLTLHDLTHEYEKMSKLPTGHWLAIRHQDQLIGISHILLENPNDHKSWIGLLMIDSDHQRHGYGKKAFLMIEEYFRSLGKETLHIGVILSNEKAFSFWSQLGFEQYRQVTADVGTQTQPVMCMAKFL